MREWFHRKTLNCCTEKENPRELVPLNKVTMMYMEKEHTRECVLQKNVTFMCKARTYKRVGSREKGDFNVQSQTVRESWFQAIK